MQNAIDNSVMDKIKALLRMAEHENSNENEAAIAMEKAQALLLKYNLTRAEIKTDGQLPTPAGIGMIDVTEETGYDWKRVLLSTLARGNLCSIVVKPSANQVHLFGSYCNVQSVLEMYNWLKPELETVAMRAWTRYKQDGTGIETARRWKYSFFLGAIDAIRAKLQKPLDEFRAGAGTAIMVQSDQMLKEAVKRVFPHLGSSYTGRASSSAGLTAGMHAGNNLNLRPTRKLSGAAMALKGG